MQSERLIPSDWLSQAPLTPDQHLYAVFSSTSDVNPLFAYRQHDGSEVPIPLWQGTPYAEWETVMPYVVELPLDSGFLEWCAQTDAQDWGWLAVSTHDSTSVFEHLRSLTQIKMPDGNTAFFRFWDGRHTYPILKGLESGANDVLPVFERYLINGQTLSVEAKPLARAKDFPWWSVPEALLKQLADEEPRPLIDNLMQWLTEVRPDLCDRLPVANLRLKVTRIAQCGGDIAALKTALQHQLEQELI